MNRVEVSNYMADIVYATPDDWERSTSFSYDMVVTDDPATVLSAMTIVNGFTDEPVLPDPCGAYVAPGVWKEFDCYNLAAIGKTTNDDPFSPSWRLIGGYWQWGRKGPDPSQWYNTNTPNFAHGPNGPGSMKANSGEIGGWDSSDVPDDSWSDEYKTANDPCPEGFRVPSKAQWEGVLDNNTWMPIGSWTEGFLVTNHTNYSSAVFFGNDLMLPSAGGRSPSNSKIPGHLHSRGRDGNYWSSSRVSSEYISAASCFRIDSGKTVMSSEYTDYGLSIRCIAEDSLSLKKSTLSLKPGDRETVTISGGTGYYTAKTSNSQVATAIISGNYVEISGLNSGTATITVEDTNFSTATVLVTVAPIVEPITITRISPSTPNSAGGVDLRITFSNISGKAIKYVSFQAKPYNSVGDVVQCEIRRSSTSSLRFTGPVQPSEVKTGYWKNLWYNYSISCVELTYVSIEFMDNSPKHIVPRDNVSGLLAPGVNNSCKIW